MATSPDAQLSFDEVVERVLAADPESFHVQATAFEEATKSLRDNRRLLVKRRSSAAAGTQSKAQTPAGQPCRDHTGGHAGDHRLGFTGGRKSTEQGEDAR